MPRLRGGYATVTLESHSKERCDIVVLFMDASSRTVTFFNPVRVDAR